MGLIDEAALALARGKSGLESQFERFRFFIEILTWLYPLLKDTDRENVTGIWQTLMPPPVFAGVRQFIRKVIGDDWAELVRRIPSLEQ